MNIGDYIYLYLFDLEKSLVNMKELREDRFGKIINIKELATKNSDKVIAYEIQLNNQSIIHYRTDNLTTNMISLSELIELIGRVEVSSDKRKALLEQINRIVV